MTVADRPSSGFPPIEPEQARVLILGSLPGDASIRVQQYYAHPRNAFWPIMQVLAGATGTYEERCRQLVAKRIAVWDVLQQSVRPGSLDSAIRTDTARPNDFAGFLSRHPRLGLIAFNGRKAEELFLRLVDVDLAESLELAGLPSTSPAHAAMSFETKLDRWRGILVPHIEGINR